VLGCPAPVTRDFFFFILKKIKISKIYVRFEKFQKYTPVALWGRQALNVIFLQICNKVPGRGRTGARGACRPPSGDRGAPSTGATGGLSSPPPPQVTGPYPLYKHYTSIPSSFEPKNSTKNPEKKRGVRRREAAKPCRIAHL